MRRKLALAFTAAGLLGLLLSAPASAQEVSDQYDRAAATGAAAMNMIVLDNIFIFLSGVLVFLMQAGFALVEAGLTRAKNAANIMMKNLMDASIGVLVFALVGWGIAYPGDFNGWIGSAGLFVDGFFSGALVDISPEALASDDFYPLAVPVDFFFQAAFAAAAATIVSGAVAGRTKFVGYIAYSIVITAFVYPVVVSWQWGGGWLSERGFSDFAGSGLVHMTGGFAALAGAIIIGPRIGKFVHRLVRLQSRLGAAGRHGGPRPGRADRLRRRLRWRRRHAHLLARRRQARRLDGRQRHPGRPGGHLLRYR